MSQIEARDGSESQRGDQDLIVSLGEMAILRVHSPSYYRTLGILVDARQSGRTLSDIRRQALEELKDPQARPYLEASFSYLAQHAAQFKIKP